jgi:hypothetical protein
MPKTFQHELKLKACAFLADGDVLSRNWCTQEQCEAWIDNMLRRYGVEIVATDIIPNT